MIDANMLLRSNEKERFGRVKTCALDVTTLGLTKWLLRFGFAELMNQNSCCTGLWTDGYKIVTLPMPFCTKCELQMALQLFPFGARESWMLHELLASAARARARIIHPCVAWALVIVGLTIIGRRVRPC